MNVFCGLQVLDVLVFLIIRHMSWLSSIVPGLCKSLNCLRRRSFCEPLHA